MNALIYSIFLLKTLLIDFSIELHVAQAGSIYSRNPTGSIRYPTNDTYGNNENKSWSVVLPGSYQNTSFDIVVVIYKLDLETSPTCNFDNLTISFGNTNFVLCGVLNDYLRPSSGQRALCIRTEQKSFKVKFKTDGSGTYSGFGLNYSTSEFIKKNENPVHITDLSACGGIFYGQYQNITKHNGLSVNPDDDTLLGITWNFRPIIFPYTYTRPPNVQDMQVTGDFRQGHVQLPLWAMYRANSYGLFNYQNNLNLSQIIPDSTVSVPSGQTYDLLITLLDTEPCCDYLNIFVPLFGNTFQLRGQLREYIDDPYFSSNGQFTSASALCIATESSSFSLLFRSNSGSGMGFAFNYTLRNSTSSFGFPRELQSMCGNKINTRHKWQGRLSTTIRTTMPGSTTPALYTNCRIFRNRLIAQRGRIEYFHQESFNHNNDPSGHRLSDHRLLKASITPHRNLKDDNCLWSFSRIQFYNNEQYRIFVITKLDLKCDDLSQNDYLTFTSSPNSNGYNRQNGVRFVLCGTLEDYIPRDAIRQTALCIKVPGTHSGQIEFRSDYLSNGTGFALSFFTSNLTDIFDRENNDKCGDVYYTAQDPPVRRHSRSLEAKTDTNKLLAFLIASLVIELALVLLVVLVVVFCIRACCKCFSKGNKKRKVLQEQQMRENAVVAYKMPRVSQEEECYYVDITSDLLHGRGMARRGSGVDDKPNQNIYLI